MANETNFWKLWAPHLVYLEDNHLDLRTIGALSEKIVSPVLVVGGGQGLLVHELQKKGFRVDGVDSSPEMVKLAEQRRGVKLILTDGSTLPFADESYRTSIIATGVVDFLDDENRIRHILDETRRVTTKDGRQLIAFYKVHPLTEQFLKRIGIITAEGSLLRRRVFELSRLEPGDFIRAIRKEGRLSLIGALFEILKLQVLLPKQERLLTKNLSMILKSADNADELIASVSESIPHHTRESIQALFNKLDLAMNQFFDFETCFVVELKSKP